MFAAFSVHFLSISRFPFDAFYWKHFAAIMWKLKWWCFIDDTDKAMNRNIRRAVNVWSVIGVIDGELVGYFCHFSYADELTVYGEPADNFWHEIWKKSEEF